MAVGNSIILLLSHVLEENFFLLSFFPLWMLFHPLHLLPCFSVLVLSKPLAQPHGLYVLYFPYPFTLTIPWPSSWWHHCFSSCMPLTPYCTLLSCLLSMFPMPSAAPPLRISCRGSPPCFPTPVSEVHTWLCIPFIQGSLHTLMEGLITSWCSRWPSLLKAVLVWWHDEIWGSLCIKFTQVVAHMEP